MVRKIKTPKLRNIPYKPKGATSTISELEGLWKNMKFPILEEKEETLLKVKGANKYCIYCKRGNGKKIINCRSNKCHAFQERYETEEVDK